MRRVLLDIKQQSIHPRRGHFKGVRTRHNFFNIEQVADMSTNLGTQINADTFLTFNKNTQKAVLTLIQILYTPYASTQGLYRWYDQLFDL